MAMRRILQLQRVKSFNRCILDHNFVATVLTVPSKMQLRRMSTEAEDIPHFLQSVFTSPDLGSGAKETKCRRFCSYYRGLDAGSRAAFLSHLAQHYSINTNTVVQGAATLTGAQDRGEAFVVKSLERLRGAMVPRYHSLFQQIGRIQGGVKFLVDMRADLLGCISGSTSELDTANFHALNRLLRELLTLWFAVGLLDLQRVTWTSACDIVQKISDYEAVHPIRNWSDLKARVGPYRRCYVFTHHSMPREPVVVLHTALTTDIASSIHSIIHTPGFHGNTPRPESPQLSDQSPLPSPPQQAAGGEVEEFEEEDPTQITTAVFYSITSTQKGLQGVELGDYLIKSVVQRLQGELPHLTNFSSLSPIPGFRDWLLRQINTHLQNTGALQAERGQPLLTDAELRSLASCSLDPELSGGLDPGNSGLEAFRQLVQSHRWLAQADVATVMKSALMRLCARYLYVEKRRGLALNPVANFHLSNGAVLWRLNWLGDTSMRGLSQACGMMVNYRYYLPNAPANSQQYLANRTIQASPSVLQLLDS